MGHTRYVVLLSNLMIGAVNREQEFNAANTRWYTHLIRTVDHWSVRAFLREYPMIRPTRK